MNLADKLVKRNELIRDKTPGKDRDPLYGCPVCGSFSVTGDSFDVDREMARQDMACEACGAQWVDRYRLEACEDLRNPEGV